MLKLCSFLLLSAFAAESQTTHQTITWVFTSTTPSLSRPKANIVDEKHPLFLLYKNGMPYYEHVLVKGTIPRIEAELKNQKLACYPGSSEAHRRKEFAYLTSQYIQPAPQIVTTKAVADQLKKKYKNKVPLRGVMDDTNLKGIIGEARSFGGTIDQMLLDGPNNLKKAVFETFSPSVLNMIEKNRADYTIEYPFILHNLRETAKAGLDLVTIPMADVGNYITQYLACSKTPEGMAVIKRADQIIRNHIKSPEYWKGVLDSIPKEDQPAFKKEIHKFTQERTKAPVIIQ